MPYTIVDSVEDFVFVIQRSDEQTPEDVERIARDYAALLRPTLDLFRERFVDPFGLKQREDAPAFAMVVLATKADFEVCSASNGFGTHYDPNATYDEKIDAAVVHQALMIDLAPAARESAARLLFRISLLVLPL